MRFLAIFLLAPLVLTTPLRAADQLADKTPAYFARHYGEPTESRKVAEYSFYLPDALPRRATVGGHFLVLHYRGDALTIEVVYLQPDNTLAAVFYTRPRVWTPAQTQEVVMAYSDNWKRTKTKGSTLAYVTPEKTLALTGINTLAIQTGVASRVAQRAAGAGDKAAE